MFYAEFYVAQFVMGVCSELKIISLKAQSNQFTKFIKMSLTSTNFKKKLIILKKLFALKRIDSPQLWRRVWSFYKVKCVMRKA